MGLCGGVECFLPLTPQDKFEQILHCPLPVKNMLVDKKAPSYLVAYGEDPQDNKGGIFVWQCSPEVTEFLCLLNKRRGGGIRNGVER